jgi:hypothetical protein
VEEAFWEGLGEGEGGRGEGRGGRGEGKIFKSSIADALDSNMIESGRIDAVTVTYNSICVDYIDLTGVGSIQELYGLFEMTILVKRGDGDRTLFL